MEHQTMSRLRRKTLAQQAAEHLGDYIDSQPLPPGMWLPSEGQLATQFGVSRSILREALRILEATGVVTVVNGKGAMVKPITGEVLAAFFARAARNRREAILEVLEVREGIEAQSASLAAGRRTLDDVAKLQQLVDRMGEHLADKAVYSELDIELHLAIAGASGNTMLYHLIESIRGALEESIRTRRYLEATPTVTEHTQQLHEAIVAAIAGGDARGAREAMARHFDEAIKLPRDG
jgi:GntR family transcriptional repressor for pyruvate dehydrogenase complex